MIEFNCSNVKCGYSKAVDEKHLGKKAKCPKCKTVTRITEDEPIVELELDAGSVPIRKQVMPVAVYDESRTFAYKGDFLGMSVEQFMQRHQSDDPSEFSMVWCNDISLADYETYGIDKWTQKEARVRTCVASGSRMTIVGAPLRLGLFTFLDEKLHSIALETKQDSLDVWPEVFSPLLEAFGTEVESKDIAGIFDTSTWKRSEGHVATVSQYEYGNPLFVRYINQTTLGDFNSVCEFHTASAASKDI